MTLHLEYAERGFPSNSAVRICLQRRNRRRHSFDPRVGKIPWSRKCQPTPVFLPEESHGQRSLEINSLQGCKESYISELTARTYACMHTYVASLLQATPPPKLSAKFSGNPGPLPGLQSFFLCGCAQRVLKSSQWPHLLRLSLRVSLWPGAHTGDVCLFPSHLARRETAHGLLAELGLQLKSIRIFSSPSPSSGSARVMVKGWCLHF